MVMAEKMYPPGLEGVLEHVKDDVKELFGKGEVQEEGAGLPGSQQPGFGKCGCHPGGIHPMDEPLDVEQRDHEGIELRAIPVKVENFVTTRELPAKRATMDTFYPSKTEPIMLQGADPRIKRLIIQVGTQPVWVGTATSINALLTQGAGTAGAGCFQMSANIQCPPWEGINEDLWVLGVNSGAIVSLRREYWSDI